jgi:hypothetical protein
MDTKYITAEKDAHVAREVLFPVSLKYHKTHASGINVWMD